MDHDELDRFRLIASQATLERIGARIEALASQEVRAAAIRADHPEFDQPLREGLDEAEVEGQHVSIRLHLAVHEILANQLVSDDPPEVFLTALRLRSLGYGRHTVLHMLMAPLLEQFPASGPGARGYDRELHLAGLRGLPGSWERLHAQAVARAGRKRSRA